jgi:hypothetical protein
MADIKKRPELSEREFQEVLEVFKILAKWRDESKKYNASSQSETEHKAPTVENDERCDNIHSTKE